MARFKKLIKNLKNYLRLAKAIYNDKRTPKSVKIVLWSALGYMLLSFDIIPDFIPVLGQLDDAIIIPSLLYLAFKLTPKKVYKYNYNKIFNK